MAFPVVETTATSGEGANTTSHTVTLPSGIVSGDLIVLCFACDDLGGAIAVSWPAGYNEIFDTSSQGTHLSVAWRLADGGEGANITVTTNNSETSSHACYRISGQRGVSPPVEVSAGATGSSVSPNPDSLTPTGGAKDYLWIAAHGHDGNLRTTTGIGANYSSKVSTEVGTLGGCGVGCAQRDLNAASEDPGVFTISVSDGWVAATVVVHPKADVVQAPGSDPSMRGRQGLQRFQGALYYHPSGKIN